MHLKRRIEVTGQSLQSPEATVSGNSINEGKGGSGFLLSVTDTLPYAKWSQE